MAKVIGFVHRIEWGSRYVRAPEGRDVAVEVFLPVEAEGCRERPREIEDQWGLWSVGYVYTVRAVTKSKAKKVRVKKLVVEQESAQLRFDFGKRRY